jgi:hypothetical protein
MDSHSCPIINNAQDTAEAMAASRRDSPPLPTRQPGRAAFLYRVKKASESDGTAVCTFRPYLLRLGYYLPYSLASYRWRRT